MFKQYKALHILLSLSSDNQMVSSKQSAKTDRQANRQTHVRTTRPQHTYTRTHARAHTHIHTGERARAGARFRSATYSYGLKIKNCNSSSNNNDAAIKHGTGGPE